MKIRRYHLLLVIIFVGFWFIPKLVSHFVSRSNPPQLNTPIDSASSLVTESLPISETQPNLLLGSPISTTAENAQLIALTFDDGPHPKMTEELLKILKEENVTATFFVVGKQAKRYPELVKKIVQAGHELGNHSYQHKNFRQLTSQERKNEIKKTHDIVLGITGQSMRFFRPPGGQINQRGYTDVDKMGYVTTLWTVLPQDHNSPSPEKIYQRVLSSVNSQGMILLHSGIKETLEVLPELIQALKSKKYQFVTCSELYRSPKSSKAFISINDLKRKDLKQSAGKNNEFASTYISH